MKVLKSIEKAKLRYSDKLEEVIWFFKTNKIRNTGKVMRDSESRETITELEEELRSFESAKEGTYDKRTEHLNMNGSAVFINRLVKEDSPYLLQHAHNPVNWFPWGEEAFEVSRSLNRPIFLSIGYSTCHWCHVMEVESFDNVEVAKVLNDHFVSIKMDREQYPDIDEIYMTGLQLISGHGGWPMSNFLLADGKPFFAATYFPPPNFKQLLLNIVNAWNEKYPELQNSANKISDSINKMLGGEREVVKLNENLAKNVCEALSQREDRSLGGLAGAPKFPQEPLILFLLERAAVTREVSTLGFVTRALEGMGRGGIYDQVGGGFHRYSVDEEWLVPHFEKMLYNQSQLALIYLQAYRFTGDAYFKRVCDQTLTYVLRDMQLPEGGFYSATDADSEGAEGIFFLWTKDEIESVLTEIEAKLIIDVYGITEVGNFEGSNILNLSRSFSDVEKRHGEDFAKRLDKVLLKLYKVREQREHPLRDEKLIVAWAAAFVNTLALAGSYFNNKEWVESAEKAIRLIVKKCVAKDFRLSRIYLNGNVSIEGQLEDYVNLIEAMLSLFDITSNLIFLNQANSLMEKCIDEFWDEESDRFYLSPANQLGPQLTRSSSAADGAVLSPTATAINCLYKLQQRRALITETTSVDYKKLADRGLSSLGGDINENPMSHTSVLRRAEQIKWGSIDLCQYSDDGLVKVSVIKQSNEDSTTKSLCFRVDLAPDWHVVATETTAQDYSRFFVAAHPKEEHWEVLDIYYPDPSGTLAPEGGTKISIYKNEFTANVNLVRSQIPEDDFSFSALLVVNLQLCNDKHCLLPTTINFRV